MRTYDVELMGYDGKDMYDMVVNAEDIETAYKIAYKKRDRKDDRIVVIEERMDCDE